MNCECRNACGSLCGESDFPCAEAISGEKGHIPRGSALILCWYPLDRAFRAESPTATALKSSCLPMQNGAREAALAHRRFSPMFVSTAGREATCSSCPRNVARTCRRRDTLSLSTKNRARDLFFMIPYLIDFLGSFRNANTILEQGFFLPFGAYGYRFGAGLRRR